MAVSYVPQIGITIIMISHDIQSAVRYASHILHLGSEIFYGTTEEYISSSEGKKYIITAEDDK